MKKRCAGLVVVLVLLAAFGVGNAQQPFHGVVNPMMVVTWVDTAMLSYGATVDTFITTDWGSDQNRMDTFDFGDIPSWPTNITLKHTANGAPGTTNIPSPQSDTWYFLQTGSPRAPAVLFYGQTGVEEPRSTVDARSLLSVSPSVVTSQMTVRVRTTGHPVVEVLDAVGNPVRTLNCTDGTATWSREDGLGRLVAEGVYFCRYATSDAVAVRKVLVTH